MFSIRRSKIPRRSLLALGAGLAATLSLPRRSHGAGIDSRDQSPRDVGRGPGANEWYSSDQTSRSVDLKTVSPSQQVTSIRYSMDMYHVTTASGATISFEEFNLRFKTDSGANGPAKGRPVLLSASMRTDRAYIVFAAPREISAFIDQYAQRQTRS
jgi:cytochrome c